MANPYVGEIRMFGGNFAPSDWAFCDGSLISITENETLFSLIGTTYGGDGQTTFALPDLRGRVPVHQNPGYPLGLMAGAEAVTLTTAQIPAHTHQFSASTVPTNTSPQGGLLAATGEVFTSVSQMVALASPSIGNAGGSQPHSNLQPALCVNFIISLLGVYPSQS